MLMETACSCSALHTSSLFALLPHSPTSLPHPLPSLSFNYPNSNSKHKSNPILSLSAIRLRKSSFSAAAVGETTIVPNEPANFNDDDGGGVNGDENGKMTQICDKLIGVFMVDKPTPNDWRKLLAFSREWDDIRPHFFRRCRERADNEDDPGKRHNLLRFARRMKEADMEAIMRNRELTQTRMMQALREELASVERRAEEERAAHNATKMAGMEREVELEHKAIEASTALARVQRIADERTAKAADLEQKVALLEVECSALNQELLDMEARARRGQKKSPEEATQVIQMVLLGGMLVLAGRMESMFLQHLVSILQCILLHLTLYPAQLTTTTSRP